MYVTRTYLAKKLVGTYMYVILLLHYQLIQRTLHCDTNSTDTKYLLAPNYQQWNVLKSTMSGCNFVSKNLLNEVH